MANFPRLKTGAVAQYPATRRICYRNQALRFVDGTEQRYRDCEAPLLRWEIRLSQLDESEMAALEEFFMANQGAFGSFTFTDPFDGATYPDCSLEADALGSAAVAEMSSATTLTVVENRS
jgi:phage-related protein